MFTTSSRLLALLGLPTLAAAQTCTPQWISGPLPGITQSGWVEAMKWVVDPAAPDAGKRLCVAGLFSVTGSNSIALWNGETWSALGSGVRNVLGQTTQLGQVFDVAQLPDGSLVVGGSFTLAGDISAQHIARWDGAAWSPLGLGLENQVGALAVTPDGRLVVGGWFTAAGGAPASRVAMWDGSAWLPMGNGLDGPVYALAALPNGEVVAAGAFNHSGTTPTGRAARWNGSAWSAMGAGIPARVQKLLLRANGDLLAGADTPTAGGQATVLRWNGASWNTIHSMSSAERIGAMAEAPNGDLWATGVRVGTWGYDFTTCSQCAAGVWTNALPEETISIDALAFAPNGEMIVAGNGIGGTSPTTYRYPHMRRRTFDASPWSVVVPADQSITCGGQAAFTAVGASGLGTLNYQWYRGAVQLTDAPGHVTGSSRAQLTISNAMAIDAGVYTCRITNACGAWTTAERSLAVAGCGPVCDPIDFNSDTLFPDTEDIADFLTVFAGGVCSGQQPTDRPCNTDIDFNNDGLFPDTADIQSLLSVFGGGPCV